MVPDSAEVIEPHLHRTQPEARQQLAARIAAAVLTAVPLVVQGGDEATRLLRAQITGHGADVRELLDERLPPPPRPGERVSAYTYTIAALATDALLDRSAELDALAAFATADDGYRWLVGGPWTGKTALAAAFASAPPPRVDVVGYFLVRPRGDADAVRFVHVVNDQLACLLGESAAQLDDADRFRALWDAAVRRAEREDRHLLLIADGLDEDVGPSASLPSVAQLLPARAGGRSHVLVLSRRYPTLPVDVPAEHPLRLVKQVELARSPHAAAVQLRAHSDLEAVFGRRDSDGLAIELLGLLAASRGPLSVGDLAELVRLGGSRVPVVRVRRVIEREIARLLEPTGRHEASRFVFAHDTLRERAETEFGADLHDLAQRLHAWGRDYAAAGWPACGVPAYLLDSYPALLRATGSARHAERLYGDLGYIEAAIWTLGVATVGSDLRAAASTEDGAFLRELSRVLDREGHNLRPGTPLDQVGYASLQMCLEAQRSNLPRVATAARNRLLSLPPPQLVPRWTTARTAPELERRLDGHNGSVWGVALSADGSRAVSASQDQTLRVWDVHEGACVTVLEGHTGPVRAVALSADGSRAVSASQDQTLRVWDVHEGACVTVLEGHTGPVTAVALSADGSRAVSASQDQTLRVWDVHEGACVTVLEGHTGPVTAVALSADGSRAVSASQDQTLRVWDVHEGACVTVLEGHTGPVTAVALSADGSRAVSASQDQTLRVWDVHEGACVTVLEGHTAPVLAVALNADASRAVSGCMWGLRVWDLQDSACVATPTLHIGWHVAVALSANSTSAISASMDGMLWVWDLAAPSAPADRVFGASVVAVALSADGLRAVSTDGAPRVWDLRNGACVAVLEGHTGYVSGVAVSPDGSRAISAGRDGTLRVWDLRDSACVAVLEGHTGSVRAVAISADGSRVVSLGQDRTLRVWDLQEAACVAVLRSHENGPTNGEDSEDLLGLLSTVTLSADGLRAVTTSFDDLVRVWDLRAGECLAFEGPIGHDVWGAAVSPDGSRAISAGRDHTLRVWDLRDGSCDAVLEGHTDDVRALAISSSGARAVSGGQDRSLRVWDLDKAICIAGPYFHPTPVISVAIATSSDEATTWLVIGEIGGAVSSYIAEF